MSLVGTSSTSSLTIPDGVGLFSLPGFMLSGRESGAFHPSSTLRWGKFPSDPPMFSCSPRRQPQKLLCFAGLAHLGSALA